MKRATRLAPTAVIALALGLAGCGGSSDSDSSAPVGSTAAQSDVASSVTFNDADVLFAQSMIPHHEQAIEMADIALDPTVGAGAEVRDLATRIKAGQDPEIRQLTSLLESWNKPTQMDMSGGHDMSTMSGMMSAEDMKALGAMQAGVFDQSWASMMIEHHEGAIEMAQVVKAGGSNPEILALADKIIDAQQSEITEMTPLAG